MDTNDRNNNPTHDSPKGASPFPTSGSHASEHPAGGSGGSNVGDEMLERIVQVAHEAIDRLAGTAAPHVHRLQDQFGLVGETLNVKASDVRATTDEWAESLRGTVRENPLAAMATAVALGLLVARLTR